MHAPPPPIQSSMYPSIHPPTISPDPKNPIFYLSINLCTIHPNIYFPSSTVSIPYPLITLFFINLCMHKFFLPFIQFLHITAFGSFYPSLKRCTHSTIFYCLPISYCLPTIFSSTHYLLSLHTELMILPLFITSCMHYPIFP